MYNFHTYASLLPSMLLNTSTATAVEFATKAPQLTIGDAELETCADQGLEQARYDDGRQEVPLVVMLFESDKCADDEEVATYVQTATNIVNEDDIECIKCLKGPNYRAGDQCRFVGRDSKAVNVDPGQYGSDHSDFAGLDFTDISQIAFVRSPDTKNGPISTTCADAASKTNFYSLEIPFIVRLYSDEDFTGERVDVIYNEADLCDLDGNNDGENGMCDDAESIRLRKGPGWVAGKTVSMFYDTGMESDDLVARISLDTVNEFRETFSDCDRDEDRTACPGLFYAEDGDYDDLDNDIESIRVGVQHPKYSSDLD